MNDELHPAPADEEPAVPGTGQPEEPPAEPLSAATPMPAERAVVPDPPKGTKTKRYTGRILLIYVILLAVLGGAVAAVVIGETGGGSSGGGSSSSKGWSDWKPKNGTRAAMAKEIADHIGSQYKLNKKGQQLVAIVSEAPAVTSGTHKVSISNIAIRTTPNGKAIKVVPSTTIWTDEFCGLGSQCSISSGKPTVARGRLVRREALEVALYTFKYVPSVDSVVAFMPPPPGQQQSTLLFLQKENLQKQLDQPLSATLPLAKPPLPSDPNPTEQATIDKLTLPAVYSYHLQQLQDASALLVLDPFQS
jgi:hypothetical protein